MQSTIRKLLAGDPNKRALRRFEPMVAAINSLEAGAAALSGGALAQKTDEFKKRLADGETLDDLLPEAFAVVREAAKRTVGERHYDVQLLGGIALHYGNIAEMRTGEGKTLVATLPVYLNALEGKGVHVVTVNDYLARRDAVWMGQVYALLGLSVGAINHDASYLYDPQHTQKDEERDETGSFQVQHEFLRPTGRRDAYHADITYGTNNEFGFDYLRDNIEYDPASLRQRTHTEGGLHYAIIDEVDSILIDEARTPLIISAPAAESSAFYLTFADIARQMTRDEDFTVDEKLRAVTLTDAGIEKAERLLGVENIYTERGIKYVHHLETAVRAKALFERDKDYVVRDLPDGGAGGQVVIVDEFTGRLQPGRRWSDGLHQAIEAKEGVAIQRESRTFASITYQNYFRLYGKIAGMTGTAETSQEEFYKVYGLNVLVIPTNKPVQRSDHEDFIFQTEKGKLTAITRKVRELNERGQPVLIGTVSIEKNELLSAHLKRAGIPHEILNAKNHEREGEIIAQAGVKGRVTIATNMAGRGVDIKLGGNPATEEEYGEVKALGGLFVLGTERHEARRIDNQLRGRSGRQGDPGETQFFVSLEDSLMRVFASDMIRGMMGRFGIAEDEPIHNKYISRALESAQTKIEGFHFDARKHVLAYDDILSQQRASIYSRRRAVLLGEADDIDEVLDNLLAGDEETHGVIERKKEELGIETYYQLVRRMLLQVIDLLWVEHLEMMDYLRSSVNLRAYGQRDPLMEYRKEALRLFQDMEAALGERVRGFLPALSEQREHEGEAARLREQAARILREGGRAAASGAVQKKYGRNEVVTITDGTETKEIKYKKAEPLIQGGKWRLVA